MTVPPQNLNAEESVLGAVMLAGASGFEASSAVIANVRATGLGPADFYRASNRIVYVAALEVAGRGEPTDVLALERELTISGRLDAAGGKPRLHELAALVPAIANAGHYAGLVVDAAELREQAEAGAALQAATENGGLAAHPKVGERVARLFEPRSRTDGTDPAVTFTEFVARRDESGAEPLITSEQGTLLPAGGLCILAAKVGGGKTTFTVDLGLHVSSGLDYTVLSFPRPLNVLVIENEGPREAFRAKLEARLEGWGYEGTPLIWDVPAECGQVRISDPAIRRRLRRVIVEHEIDLVVSDSLTRFGVRGNGTPEETREFVEWLTELGLGRDVAFLLLHHPRTRAEEGETELEQIAGAWPPHADLILRLQRLSGNRARLSFPKTRWPRGDQPACVLAFDPEAETFSYVGIDEAEERDYVGELREHMADGAWHTVTGLRKPKDKGGIGAAPDAIKQALKDDCFESASGNEIGERADATYYRVRQASRGPGDARDASRLTGEEGKRHPSPPYKGTGRAVTLDAASGHLSEPDALDPTDEDEIERLTDLARAAQREATDHVDEVES